MKLSFSTFLVVAITGAEAKIGNYNTIDNKHDTIDEMCDQANISDYSKIAKMCKELGSKGLNVGADDAVFLHAGALDKFADQTGPSFNMRTILEAEDAEAAFNDIEAGIMMKTGRKLVDDYGWCSARLEFLVKDGDDSSNYCDEDQECDSGKGGCGTPLSSCCIDHDKCLNSVGDNVSTNDRCTPTDCKGLTCDQNLGRCAWDVSCCSRFKVFSCDSACLATTAKIESVFKFPPNSGHNPLGTDSDSICSDNGLSCEFGSQCLSGRCDGVIPNRFCEAKLESGVACDEDNDCISGSCVGRSVWNGWRGRCA